MKHVYYAATLNIGTLNAKTFIVIADSKDGRTPHGKDYSDKYRLEWRDTPAGFVSTTKLTRDQYRKARKHYTLQTFSGLRYAAAFMLNK